MLFGFLLRKKNTGTNSVGYSPFDHYDLGDKYQKELTPLGSVQKMSFYG